MISLARRAFVFVPLGLFGLLALACSFPDVTYAQGDATTDDVTTSDTTLDGGATGDALASDVLETKDVVYDTSSDVVIVGDADTGPDAACDRDHDGVDAKGACGGTDCDDNDARANTNVTKASTAPPGASGGDWNCDGVPQKQLPHNVSCSFVSVGKCSQVFGFSGDPACGEEGDYITGCVLDVAVCKPTTKKDFQSCL